VIFVLFFFPNRKRRPLVFTRSSSVFLLYVARAFPKYANLCVCIIIIVSIIIIYNEDKKLGAQVYDDTMVGSMLSPRDDCGATAEKRNTGPPGIVFRFFSYPTDASKCFFGFFILVNCVTILYTSVLCINRKKPEQSSRYTLFERLSCAAAVESCARLYI